MNRIFARPDPDLDETELERFASQLFASLRAERPREASVERARAALAERLRCGPQAAPAPGWGGLRRALAGGIALLPLAAVGTVAAMSGTGIGPVDVPRVPGFSVSGGGHTTSLDIAAQHEGDDGEAPTETPAPTVTPTPPSSKGADAGQPGALGGSHGAEVCATANSRAQAVLRSLLESGRLDADGQTGVSHALQALTSCGKGEDAGSPPSEPPGPPADVPRGGPPDGVPPGPPPHANGNGHGSSGGGASGGTEEPSATTAQVGAGAAVGFSLAGEAPGNRGAGAALEVAAGARGLGARGR